MSRLSSEDMITAQLLKLDNLEEMRAMEVTLALTDRQHRFLGYNLHHTLR